MPTPPGMTPRLSSDDQRSQCFQIDIVPTGYVNIYTSLPNAHFFNLDASAKDSQQNKHYNPNLLMDEGISTG